jgi:hypothetical protein
VTRRLKYVVGVATVAAGALMIWGAHARKDVSMAHAGVARPVPQTSLVVQQDPHRAPSGMAATIDPRELSRKTSDYYELVVKLLPSANAGSPAAEYEVARTLKFCNDAISSYFTDKVSGSRRSLETTLAIFASFPPIERDHISDIYHRCSGFFEDAGQLANGEFWLERAVSSGYAAAKFLQAEELLEASISKSGAQAQRDVETARRLAIEASATGDPDAVFGMAGFVNPAIQSQEKISQLSSAWRLLGCDLGADCSPTSQWMSAICSHDPQCANGLSVVELTEQIEGAKFGEVLLLKEQLKVAISKGDPEAIRAYL